MMRRAGLSGRVMAGPLSERGIKLDARQKLSFQRKFIRAKKATYMSVIEGRGPIDRDSSLEHHPECILAARLLVTV